jgi:hypothetical protein
MTRAAVRRGSFFSILCVLGVADSSRAAPVVRSATILVTMTSSASCDVAMRFEIEGASVVEHRVESHEGSRVDLVDTLGARIVGEPTPIGRTQALTLAIDRSPYELRYHVDYPPSQRARCPLWLPTVPTDGVSRHVLLQVALPPGASPGSSMPAMEWVGNSGTVRLGNIPAFVLVPFARAGEATAVDVSLVMDLMSAVLFVAASVIWLWRRRARLDARRSG